MIPVVALRPDGLGTRLLTTIYARQFAEKIGATLSVAWPSLEDANYANSHQLLKEEQITEIFEGKKIFIDRDDVEIIQSSQLTGKRLMHLHGMHEQIENGTIGDVENISATFDYIVYDLPYPVTLAGSDPKADALQVKKLWNQFNFAKDVMEAFSYLSQASELDQSVAVHVRRGDVLNKITEDSLNHLKTVGATQIFQRFVPLKTVVRAVSEHFADARSLIVCSEDATMRRNLQGYFPDSRVLSANGYFSAGGNKSALLDLLILSRAKHLISPFKSYFSECASILGQCNLHNAGLDIPSLMDEITIMIDKVQPPDANIRKAIFYMFGYKNLWYDPENELRAHLLKQAVALDEPTARELTD